MKLIVADLDGTIVHNKVITNKSKETIKRLQNEGYIFTIATGRHVDTAVSVIEELNISGPVITNNGAVVLNPSTNTILSENFIDEETVEKAILLCDETNTPYILYKSQEIVGTKESCDLLEGRIGKVNKVATIVSKEELRNYHKDVVKILMIEESDQKYKFLQKSMTEIKGINVVASSFAFLDIVHEDSSKGNGLRTLCNYYGVTLNDCVTIGDQENDISMVQVAKTGIAMGNANPLLKEVANVITKSYENDGFTYAMKKFVFDDLMFELTEEFVQLADCQTIEDAIDIVKLPLMGKFITDEYVSEVVETVKKDDYFVLLDQIAFLHVNPKYGSNEVGLSVLLLKNSVQLLTKNVKVVLLLSGQDDTHHLKLLKHLSMKLKNGVDEQLRNASTKEEIINILK